MKVTRIICDGCKKEITPVLNGAYPRVSIALSAATVGRHDPEELVVTELCAPCFITVRKALKTVMQACDDVGKDDLED
jgi:hypothetical protein